jgi:GTP-binding protein
VNISSAIYLQSVVDWRKCPTGRFPEYAFIGRSNVGKSSLINMLTRHNGLAKTSSKPGKTQTINHFLINSNWYLVDLPGYGYASISKTMREKWTAMIDHYLALRPNLQLVFVLIDARLDPQKNDLEFINRLGENGIPFAIIFTKTDKVSKLKVSQNVAKFKEKMLETWEELPPFFLSSAEKGDGRDEILNYIEGLNGQFDPNTLP